MSRLYKHKLSVVHERPHPAFVGKVVLRTELKKSGEPESGGRRRPG